MNKESIFDSHYKNEYMLLKLLYISSNEISKQEICQSLNITLPTLSKLVSNIKNDFHGKLQNSKIQFVVKRNTLELIYEGNISLDDLTMQLITNSCKYRLLESIFFNKNKGNSSLGIGLNISNSTLSRVINTCNEFLLEYDLKIKRGKIEGSFTQYCYFFYMLFLISPKKKAFSSQISTNILNSIGNIIDISVSKKEQMKLWVFLLVKKLKSTRKIKLTEMEKRNLKQTSKTKLFKQLKQIYLDETIINNDCEAEIFAYFMCLFLISFGIVSYSNAYLKLFRRENPAFELTNKIMALLRLNFTNVNDSFEIVENNIFSLISQTFYFKGRNFSIDTVTAGYYNEIFNSSLRYAITEKILNTIIKPTEIFDLNQEKYIKENLVLCLYVLIPKKEYKINIGILTTTLNWIVSSLLLLIEKRLNIYQDVLISEYNTSENYDLLITDFDIDNLRKNYTHHYKVTDLGVDIDFDKVTELINEIILEKYYG